jgi:hypothetical protein
MTAFWTIAHRYDPDYGGSTHLGTVGILLRDCTTPYLRRQSSSYTPPREPEISQSLTTTWSHLFKATWPQQLIQRDLMFQGSTQPRCTTGLPVFQLARLSVPWQRYCSSRYCGLRPCSVTKCNQARACEWIRHVTFAPQSQVSSTYQCIKKTNWYHTSIPLQKKFSVFLNIFLIINYPRTMDVTNYNLWRIVI